MPRKLSMWRERLLLLVLFGQIVFRDVDGSVTPGLYPAMFIFGDSLVDSGNNNFLPTFARADFLPNGIDFGTGWPTGRFCNGRTVADYIGLMVGIDPVPPYLALLQNKGMDGFTNGINFASGAAGILDESGYNYLARIPLSQQLGYFASVRAELVARKGKEEAERLLAKSLYFVEFGSNDYINNYLQPTSFSKLVYTPEAYQELLVTTYIQQIKALYRMGARKILLGGVGPLGCIPAELNIFKSPNGRCIESLVNKLVRGYNKAIKENVEKLVKKHNDLHILFADAYKQIMSFMHNHSYYGFTNVDTSCCGEGKYGADLPCIPTAPYCIERDAYVFWDRHHPTDKANLLIAKAYVYGSDYEIISPMNILQLAQL